LVFTPHCSSSKPERLGVVGQMVAHERGNEIVAMVVAVVATQRQGLTD
jgi:hypothetical protein